MSDKNDFVVLFKSVNFANYVGFEGKSEKLSCVYSVMILSFLTVLIFSKSFILSPMSCYVPSVPMDNSKSFMSVFNNFCWINGTSFIQSGDKFPINEANWNTHSTSRKISKLSIIKKNKYQLNLLLDYYQWIPLILAVQCLLFYLPYRLWKTMSFSILGMDCNLMMEIANGINSEFDNKKRNNVIRNVADEIRQMITTFKDDEENRGYGERIKKWIFDTFHVEISGKRLLFLFLSFKIIYAINVVIQCWKIYFLFQWDSEYSTLSDVIEATFPLIGFCYFPTSLGIGNTNGYYGQCNLTVNMINSKIFIFLFIWTLIVSIVSVGSIVTYLIQAIQIGPQFTLIKDLLKKRNAYEKRDREVVKKFVKEDLKSDGVLMIRKLKENVNASVASEVVEILYREFIMNITELEE